MNVPSQKHQRAEAHFEAPQSAREQANIEAAPSSSSDLRLASAGSKSTAVQSSDAPTRTKKAPRVALALAAVAVLIGSVVWLVRRGNESTDDAQVEGHVIAVSARIPGQVKRILVTDNQMVNDGDVLVELDTDELNARLHVAKADRMAAEASLALARAQLALTEKNTLAGIRQARGGTIAAACWVAARLRTGFDARHRAPQPNGLLRHQKSAHQ